MPNTVLGKVACTPRGDYAAGTSYEILDIVGYGGGSYMALKNDPEGAPSNDGVNWMQLAAQGEPGTSVASIQRTSGTGAPGTTDTYTMYDSAGEAIGTFTVYNGANGTGTGDFMANGTVPMTGNLQMGGNKVTNLGAPGADTDAVRKQDLDAVAAEVDGILDGTTPAHLAPATETKIGGVIIGEGLSVTEDGTVSAGPGKRTARFTVGTSTAGWTTADCDYLCDGTDDQVEINAAIQALPTTGGEVVTLDGTFNITAAISVNKKNVKLSGNGAATVLKRMWNSTTIRDGIIYITAGGYWIEGLSLNGNKADFGDVHNSAICCYFNGAGVITGNNIYNCQYCAIQMQKGSGFIISDNCIYGCSIGISQAGSRGTIANNNCYNNDIGIEIDLSSTFCTVTGNTCIRGTGTAEDYSSGQHTIRCLGSNNLITGNNIMGKNYVDAGTGNTWANNKYE